MRTTRFTMLSAFVAVIASLCGSAYAQCPASYSVDILAGPDCAFESSNAYASALNDGGELCGGFYACDKTTDAAVWLGKGEWIPLTGIPSEFFGFGPLGINSVRQMAGFIGLPLRKAGVYNLETHTLTNLGTLPGHNFSEALAINDTGVACGYSHNTVSGPKTAFIWQDGTMSPLVLPFGRSSVANDISDTGLVCGWMGQGAHIDGHAFVYELSSGKVIDAGVQLDGAVGSRATGISDSGAICGYSNVPCGKLCVTRRSFVWNGENSYDLGVLPEAESAFAQAINNHNVIVGYCDPIATAFIWQSGIMTALNDLIPPELNLNIRIAWDINNAGQIVGEAGVIGTFDRVAVRLTPIPSPIGDSDCDSDVDVDDLLKVINTWGAQSPKGSNALPPADFDHDTIVEIDDLMIVIDNWTN